MTLDSFWIVWPRLLNWLFKSNNSNPSHFRQLVRKSIRSNPAFSTVSEQDVPSPWLPRYYNPCIYYTQVIILGWQLMLIVVLNFCQYWHLSRNWRKPSHQGIWTIHQPFGCAHLDQICDTEHRTFDSWYVVSVATLLVGKDKDSFSI